MKNHGFILKTLVGAALAMLLFSCSNDDNDENLIGLLGATNNLLSSDIPDYMAQSFKEKSLYLRIMMSANSGAEFNLHQIDFFNAYSDDNRVLNLTQQQKDNAVLYSNFISNPYVHGLQNLIVYKIIDGKKHYYRPGQDVNEQMILVELWARNPAYEPGLPSGFWRQCWVYLGKE